MTSIVAIIAGIGIVVLTFCVISGFIKKRNSVEDSEIGAQMLKDDLKRGMIPDMVAAHAADISRKMMERGLESKSETSSKNSGNTLKEK